MTKIIGIDPGTAVMGYGVIESTESEVHLVHCGALNTEQRSSIGERLKFLYNNLLEILKRFQPDAVAVEQPFVAKNVRSALAVGKAQAVAILAAANMNIPVYEYTPAQVKQSISNYGAGSKEQIQEMVKLQLGLDDIPRPADAADALAVAICHLYAVRLDSLISTQGS